MATPASSSPLGPLRWLGRLLLPLPIALLVWLFWPRQPLAVPNPSHSSAPAPSAIEQVARGRYLATLGNCQGCHSLPGQAPYAGGTPIATPFGTVYGPNLTPSKQGLQGWSGGDFWRALHFGQAPDGRWLNPTFPYTHTTHVAREDSEALFAFLQSLPPDATPNRPSELRWPYNTQAALKVWRALYFTPAETPEPPRPGGELARGRYLVQGLGHCGACHTPRDRWGGLRGADEFSGAMLPSGWYAPSLLDPAESGVQRWSFHAVTELLGQGRSGHHAATGPMAEVVAQSMRHWTPEDVGAVARFLIDLPVVARRTPPPSEGVTGDRKLGARLYDQHCAACHGDQGQGWVLDTGQVAYPPLAGNRAVTLGTPANLVKVVQEGGFGLSTPAHPQPFGMPPFQLVLDDAAMAALLTHIRQSWSNTGGVVQPLDVHRLRNNHVR